MPSTYIHLAFRFTSVITFLAGSAAALRAYSTLAREAQLAKNEIKQHMRTSALAEKRKGMN